MKALGADEIVILSRIRICSAWKTMPKRWPLVIIEGDQNGLLTTWRRPAL
ncbi:hypothetical protein KCP78_05425 [Salmonella enterica subsp. enterica]|nr:hypothetical protein KCP78_05425 [Salmonella enterica subsp. enterica]